MEVELPYLLFSQSSCLNIGVSVKIFLEKEVERPLK